MVPERPEVIAYRKACRTTGTGLSHYVLLTNGPRKVSPRGATEASQGAVSQSAVSHGLESQGLTPPPMAAAGGRT